MTDSRPVEEGHFGMILTKEEAALIMALRHTPGMKIRRLLSLAAVGNKQSKQFDYMLERDRVHQIINIYRIKINEGLGVTV